DACEQDWREGQFYKIRATYGEHERYGPQIDIQNLRLVTDSDQADGFRVADFLDSSRYDPEVMFAELTGLAQTHIADLPLRRLVLTILNRYARPLKQLPATQGKFYPFVGGLLEHTVSVTRI